MALVKEIIDEKSAEQPAAEIVTKAQADNLLSQGFTMEMLSSSIQAAVKATIESLGLQKPGGYENLNDLGQPVRPLRAEEVLPDPINFYAPSMTFVMTASHHDGIQEPFPHGVKCVVFKFEAAKMQRGGKEQNIQVISKYICTSKPMLEALRKDFRYGSLFWEGSAKNALSVDTKVTERLIAYLTSYSNRDAGSVFSEAMSLGIDTKGVKITELKMKLATLKAMQDYEEDVKRTRERLDNTTKALLIQNGTEPSK